MVIKMKVFVITKDAAQPIYGAVLQKLSELGIGQCDSMGDCDVVITIGGDGTILNAGKEAAAFRRPLLGINTGRLGFMATLEKDELAQLERLKSGEYTTSGRMLLEVNVRGDCFTALNEVVLHRGTESTLPDFAVHRGGVEVMRLRADGVIVSTPTGSTAYSLSAGGPIIEPELACFLVTALSPHTLFNRPMVFSPDADLSVNADGVFVTIDGRDITRLGSGEGEGVVITKSQHRLDLLDIDGNGFFDSIHDKLMKPLK